MSRFGARPDFLTQQPTWAVDFAPGGRLLRIGERITRRRLADTLSTIAHEGPDVFYTGPMAKAMIAALQADGGIMTMEDLASYSIEVRPAIHMQYRDRHHIYSCGAPCSGSVVLNALKTLEGYEDLFRSRGENLIIDRDYHRLAEALKFAYGRRTKLADPAFVGNVTAFVDRFMLSPEVAHETRQRISDSHTLSAEEYYNPDRLEVHSDRGTSHMAAADSSGLAISTTTSINLPYGSHLMVPETGVIMNDNMDGFSIPGISNSFGVAPFAGNYPAPGKRPLSSMSPTIVETQEDVQGTGSSLYLIGAAGGPRIISATVQNIINVLDRGMSVVEALSQPRMHHQLSPNRLECEWALDNRTVDEAFKARGHDVSWIPFLSYAQAIQRLPSVTNGSSMFEVASEPRQSNSMGIVVVSGNGQRGRFTKVVDWMLSHVQQSKFWSGGDGSEL